MAQYKKLIAQLVATAGAAIAAAVTDNQFTASEKINVLIVVLGALGVLGAGNLPEGVWKYMKGYVSAGTAVAVVIASAITDGITYAEMLQAGIAGLGAVGVVAVAGPVVSSVINGKHAVK